MPPLLRPSPPLSKEPPDKINTHIPLSAPSPISNTSMTMNPDQPPASPSIRPPFNPFFTLIHDTATSTTHHPRNVHYIFSDDDPSLLTTACLSALSSPTASYPSPSRPRAPQNPSTSSSSAASKSPSSSTAVPGAKPARENRILLLDLDESGTSVTQANSLSSSWQIVSTALTPAPTWDESPSEPHAASSPLNGGAGFMLKISGTDGRQAGTGRGMGLGLGLGKAGARANGEVTEAEFQALMGEFEARMKVLRTVVEAGDEVGRREERGMGEGGRDGQAEIVDEREQDTGIVGDG